MRPSKETTWLKVCRDIAGQSTCLRRAVGCVLVNARGHVLSTGYNGVAPGKEHCNEGVTVFDGNLPVHPSGAVPRGIKTHVEHPHACAGAKLRSGEGLDLCEAIHAEQNALLQCRDVWEINTCYVTTAPCVPCVKLLLVSSCRRVVFVDDYPQADAARRLFLRDASYTWLKWEV